MVAVSNVHLSSGSDEDSIRLAEAEPLAVLGQQKNYTLEQAAVSLQWVPQLVAERAVPGEHHPIQVVAPPAAPNQQQQRQQEPASTRASGDREQTATASGDREPQSPEIDPSAPAASSA